MKKLLLAALVIVALGCNAHVEKVAQSIQTPVADVYPYIAPNDPYVVNTLDEMIAESISEGWELLGMAADIEDDTMLWLNNPKGECVCVFLVFTQGNVVPVPSCEEGLSLWVKCVNAGECAASGERKVNKSQGVWF